MNKTILIAVLIFAFIGGNAQETEKLSRKEKKALKEAKQIEETKALLDNKVYVFSPTQALPSSMRSRNLDGSFSAKINNDTIDCYLPFYGRAYSADYGSSDGPFTFTLPIENYTMENSKKGYMVKFEVKNKNDNINFMFQIGETGSATLNLTSTNRQSISYYGNIEKPDK
ncbi:DUF4251 domain-containing protein [Draconibacterium sp.]|nr:DUF4251 domain-containing protein [Draconibacterium sp.]